MSRFALPFCAAVLFCAAFFFYPKWEKPGTEATISYDAAGYYLYLPATFIYKDLKKVAFRDSIAKKYGSWNNDGPGTTLPNGNWVIQYSSGQALQELPAFLMGHLSAKISGQPADGFSRPYQMALSWWGLFVAFVGLFFLQKILREYFSKTVAAITLVAICLGTNYLNYASIDNALTHNWLFTLYTLLIFSTLRFYRAPSMGWAAAIGLLVGWAILTRPTEIISAILPVLWGIGSRPALRERLVFLKEHFPKILLAGVLAVAVGSIQLFYWKYVSGHWLVYSYGNQEFTWLHPHLMDGALSGRAGWLVYSPMMWFGVFGMLFLMKKRRDVFPAAFIFCAIFMYITWAWDIWWYGGSLGQRAMVQSYPVWAFAVAAFVDWAMGKNWRRWVFAPIAAVFIYFNLWITYQAHGGGLFQSEQMTAAYLKAILFTYKNDPNNLKLLDTDESFSGEKMDAQQVFFHDFEQDTIGVTTENAINGLKSGFLNKETQFTPAFEIKIPQNSPKPDWLRVSANARIFQKEWNFWNMTQFVVRFTNAGKIVKDRAIRVQRLLDENSTGEIYFDVKIPASGFDKCEVYFWNAESQKAILIDNLRAEVFN